MAAACIQTPMDCNPGSGTIALEQTYPWFALYVRSRHEKHVQTHLVSKGYRTSLPLAKCYRTRSSGQIWESTKPLLSGYVFVALDITNPHHIVTTPGVVQIVGSGHCSSQIPYGEIEALERIAQAQLPVAHCAYTRIGEGVRLVHGPLKGVEGIVLRDSGPTRLVVSVTILQRSLSVEIENTWAVPLTHPVR